MIGTLLIGTMLNGMTIMDVSYSGQNLVKGVVLLAAVITPSGDPVNLTIFSAPMLGLYVLSIGVAWMFGKKRPAIAPSE